MKQRTSRESGRTHQKGCPCFGVTWLTVTLPMEMVSPCRTESVGTLYIDRTAQAPVSSATITDLRCEHVTAQPSRYSGAVDSHCVIASTTVPTHTPLLTPTFSCENVTGVLTSQKVGDKPATQRWLHRWTRFGARQKMVQPLRRHRSLGTNEHRSKNIAPPLPPDLVVDGL